MRNFAILCLLSVFLLSATLYLGCQPQADISSQAPSPTPTIPKEPPQELLDAIMFAMPKEGPTEPWQEARRLFYTAYMLQFQGKLEQAIEYYQRSIEVFPTAEAYTFLGWTYSWMGQYDYAIYEAQQAIALDPEYGNPYNDIGVYLMAQGKLDEAIPWLNRAMEAKRYANPEYPWFNLGHIWVQKGEWGKALACYEEVLKLSHEYAISAAPVLEASLFLPPEEGRNLGTIAEQSSVIETVTRYLQAWSIYDADALKNYSDPLNTELSIALLLHLANIKLAEVTITAHNSQVLHLEDGMAIVETSTTVNGNRELIWHLLQQTNDTWKVVVRLLPVTAM